MKRLNIQHKFISKRLKGLSEAIFGYSKRGQNPPKELLSAHKSYIETAAYIEARRGALQYAMRDADITSLEAANNA